MPGNSAGKERQRLSGTAPHQCIRVFCSLQYNLQRNRHQVDFQSSARAFVLFKKIGGNALRMDSRQRSIRRVRRGNEFVRSERFKTAQQPQGVDPLKRILRAPHRAMQPGGRSFSETVTDGIHGQNAARAID